MNYRTRLEVYSLTNKEESPKCQAAIQSASSAPGRPQAFLLLILGFLLIAHAVAADVQQTAEAGFATRWLKEHLFQDRKEPPS